MREYGVQCASVDVTTCGKRVVREANIRRIYSLVLTTGIHALCRRDIQLTPLQLRNDGRHNGPQTATVEVLQDVTP